MNWNEELKWLKPEWLQVSKNTMEVGNFKAELKFAPRLEGSLTYRLPPGRSASVFPISCLPGSPSEWVREEGVYVAPVETDVGIWFDWTMNNKMNTAVLPSVKGMNPITGLNIDGPGLHSYKDKCPIHDEDLSGHRVCDSCGYAWPPQNYVTYESTLWLDGFRQPDGSVRQFFFTNEDRRDIASAVIGEENAVPAFGFVFYRPKVEREQKPKCRDVLVGCKVEKAAQGKWSPEPWTTWTTHASNTAHYSLENSIHGDFNGRDDSVQFNYCNSDAGMLRSLESNERDAVFSAGLAEELEEAELPDPSETKSKSVSVGAGANIKQELRVDELGIDGWKNEHSGVIRLYFVFEEQFRQIVNKGGIKGIQTNDSGFLDGLPVG